MAQPLRFAFNRMLAPQLDLPGFIHLAKALGSDAIEIRNDLKGVEIEDGTPPQQVKALCQAEGVRVLSINALYPFDVWNNERLRQAQRLADYAQGCGAEGLVLCPLNEHGDPRDAAARARDLRTALTELAPILREHGLLGFVEPLGFVQSALRTKADAVAAINAVGGRDVYRLVHDTFHHHLANEQQYFPELTGLVHISGVESAEPVDTLLDGHRVLIGDGDLLGNAAQIQHLLAAGYQGYLSFEPFAGSVHQLQDVTPAVQASMAWLQARVGAGSAA